MHQYADWLCKHTTHNYVQGACLHWPLTPSGAYSVGELPNELAACGDPGLHEEVVKLLQGSA